MALGRTAEGAWLVVNAALVTERLPAGNHSHTSFGRIVRPSMPAARWSVSSVMVPVFARLQPVPAATRRRDCQTVALVSVPV
jgi:hypothetical protein